MSLHSCPSEEVLLEALDSESEAELDSVVVHLESCDACQRIVEARFASDEVVDELRAAQQVQRDSGATLDPEDLDGFLIRREVCRGGQGVVYEAEDCASGRTVALKALRRGLHASDRELRRFQHEMRIASSLSHPNIVRLYQCGRTSGGQLYFSMEFIVGVDLTRYCQNLDRSREDYFPGLLGLFLKICAGISHAHEHGIIHRDLKPSNILIEANEPRILDFGLAKNVSSQASGDSSLTQRFDFIGTLAWSAPEQVPWVDGVVDTRTDVYTLGLILNHMLTLRHPYDVSGGAGRVLRSIEESEPCPPSTRVRLGGRFRNLDAIVLKALRKSPNDRYQSVDELADDCRRLVSGEALAPLGSRLVGGALGRVLRHPATRWGGLVGAALLLWFLPVKSLSSEREAPLELRLDQQKMAEGPDSQSPGRGRSEERDPERAIWSELLAGKAQISNEAPNGFPGSITSLMSLRGIYARLPVIATYGLDPERWGGPWRFPTECQLVFCPRGPNESECRILSLPHLAEQSVTIPGPVEVLRIAENGHWFFQAPEGCFVWDGTEVRTLADVERSQGAEFELRQQAGAGFISPLERELYDSLSETADRESCLFSWLRFPDLAMLRHLSSAQVWRQIDGDWRADGGWDSVRRMASNWNGELRLLTPSSFSDDPFSDYRMTPLPSSSTLAAAFSLDESVFAQVIEGDRIGVRRREGSSEVVYDLNFHDSLITKIWLDPTGRYLASWGHEGAFRVADLSSLRWGDPFHGQRGPLVSVQSIARSHSRIASVGVKYRTSSSADEGIATVRLSGDTPASVVAAWPMDRGRRVSRLTGVVFIPGHEDHLLLAGEHHEFRVWSYLEPGRALVPLNQGLDASSDLRFNCLAACAASKQVAAASEQGVIVLLAFGDDDPFSAAVSSITLPPPARRLQERVSSLAWSARGESLVAGRGDGSVLWIEPESSSIKVCPSNRGQARCVASSLECDWVASGWDNGEIGLWRWGASEPEYVLRPRSRTENNVYAVAFSHDGKKFYSGDRGGFVRIWDLSRPGREPICVSTFRSDTEAVLALEACTSESAVLAGSGSGLTRWDLSKFDQHIAGNLKYWAGELASQADPSTLQRLEHWARSVTDGMD